MRRLLAFVALAFTAAAAGCSGNDATAPSTSNEPAVANPAVPPPSLATASNGDGLSITTDKDDYQPGDTVWFTGAGWQPADTLDIVLSDEPATHEPHTWLVPVNETGGFRDSTYVVDVGDIGVTFTLTATSRATSQSLTVTFTDAVNQAPIQVREATCTTAQTSFTLGATVCGRAGPLVIVGAGNNNFRIQWIGPSPSTTVLQQQTFSSVTNGSVHTNTFTPTSAGTYTVRTVSGLSGGAVLSSAQFTITAPSNNPPVLNAIGNTTVPELTQLAFTATATDDNPGLTFSLANPASGTFPTGAQITGAGAFTWTPTESQGPGTYRVKIVVTDAGSLSDEEEIQIIVTEVNLPPVLGSIGPKTIDEEAELAFTATATDPDVPANVLTFSLQPGTDPVPAGAAIDPTTGAFTWTPTEAQGPGVYKFKVRVTDNGVAPANLFDEEEITVTVNEVNKPPVLDAIGNKSVNEGSLLTFTATATDPDIPANTLTFSLQTGANPDLATAGITTTGVFTWTPVDDNPTGTDSDPYGVTVVVTDNGVNPANLFDQEQITITVSNVAPTITSVSLDPAVAGYLYPITGQPTVKVTFTDPGANDTHQCTFDVKDEVFGTVTTTTTAAVVTVLPERKCESPLNAPAAGLYTVKVTVTDDDTGSGTQTFPTGGMLIVIYDPSAGFVTGGGWINSPPGACRFGACQQETTGKATFGFVSKYISQKDKTTPVLTGNTEFQFHAGSLNFKSGSYDWLVVNGGSGRAQYKGVGTINGGGNYGFMLTAYDGATDKFRIKIWDVSSAAVVYDNQMNQPDTSTLATELGAGSIIIHVKK